eukprot:TRINITY_DN7482_c0_g1_i1.p1 TRINITY_DN7482_c0_g1~~TRINITY_DN7482_c0_g1_i1.p1  ORF type:complete len:2042 (-),score=367.44 TRINITY_DN7482_c0_g1_i1:55-5421(-)
MKEFGPICCASTKYLDALLREFNKKFDEQDIAEIIGMMAVTLNYDVSEVGVQSFYIFLHLQPADIRSPPVSWNTAVFSEVISQNYPKLHWPSVIKYLDHAELEPCDSDGFNLILDIYERATKGRLFPTECLFGKWKNINTQFSLLEHAMLSKSCSFPATQALEDILGGLELNNKNFILKRFYCIPFLETLLELSKSEKLSLKVIELFKQYPFEISPEVFILGLILIRNESVSHIKNKLICQLLTNFLENETESTSIVLQKMWSVDENIVIDVFIKIYNNNPSMISKILSLSQESGLFNTLLTIDPMHSFTIDLAALASRMDSLYLEKWLREMIRKHGDTFCLSVIRYLKERLRQSPEAEALNTKYMRLAPETVHKFLDKLRESTNSMSENVREEFRNLIGSSEHEDFSEDIEREANKYFKKIYKGYMTLEQIIDLLKTFKSSDNPREQKIFACMIRNLFDEYRFFPEYPDVELYITGVIFGSLIQHQIISFIPLGMALRYVILALKKPVGTKMFNFGLYAIQQFKSRLPEWPHYCQYILQIPHLSNYPDIVQEIKDILSGNYTPEAQEPKDPSDASDVETNIFNSQDQIEKPEEEVCDTIHFVLNTLSENNIDEKVEEFSSVVRRHHYLYFVTYMVLKRIAQEENFHKLYLKFVLNLDSEIEEMILEQTVRSIQTIISSSRIRVSEPVPEKKVLNNLGNWLALMNFPQNKPILFRDLSLKDAILDAYEDGKLISIIPFIRIILSHTVGTIFEPPNPWTMAIFRLLVEIYNLKHLELKLNFEVEILSKSLGLEIESTTPTDLLKYRNVYRGPGPIIDFEHLPEPIDPPESRYQLRYMNINPNLNIPHDYDNILLQCVNASIKEVLNVVRESSVMIASITARELVRKDFAMEPDENAMLTSATYIVQNLAGNLASVTSKDTLKSAMATKFQSVLTQNSNVTPQIKRIVTTLVVENLDLACAVVQKATAEASINPTIKQLQPDAVARKEHRERTRGQSQAWYDINYVGSSAYGYISNLPEPLRPKLGGVTPYQLKLYQDFLSYAPYQNPANLPRNVSPREDYQAPPPGKVQSETPRPDEERLTVEHSKMVFKRFTMDIHQFLNETNINSLSELPGNHRVFQLIAKIETILLLSEDLPATATYGINVVFPKLFSGALEKEIYIGFLDTIIELFADGVDIITDNYINGKDRDRYNRHVVHALLTNHLLNVPVFDKNLCEWIRDNRGPKQQKVIDFSKFIIETCLLKNMIVNSTDLTCTLDELQNISEKHNYEHLGSLVAKAKSLSSSNTEEEQILGTNNEDVFQIKLSSTLKSNFETLCNEWNMAVYQSNDQGTYTAYFQKLQNHDIFVSGITNTVLLFFKYCIEKSLVSYNEELNETEKQNSMNSLGALLFLFVKHSMDKALILNRILSVLAQIMENQYNANPMSFNQRPYYNLIVFLLGHLNIPDPLLGPFNMAFMKEIYSFLYYFRPSDFPGFSFVWLELVSHRSFMPKILKKKSDWEYLAKLLVELFKFLEPHLQEASLSEPMRVLYKGTLRVLLVLIHDFPEFLCAYHFSFCDVIPTPCIQLRNLILSAYPRVMKLPNPFTPNLKVDLLPDIKDPPVIRSDFAKEYENSSLGELIDIVIKTGQASLIPALKFEDGRYNIKLINSLVLTVGTKALSNSTNSSEYSAQAPMSLFRYLAINLDTEGRYILFNAIANQLRYPNNHTHFFSCVLLFLFSGSTSEIIQEQITRVLVERLIVQRPHPWGLLITFIELIKNPTYHFWSRNFTHCAPEIERLFQQVGTRIAQHKVDS